MAAFLLTNLLLDKLLASKPSRIINVASDAHTVVKGIDFESVFCKGKYNGIKAYAQSKLALIIFTYELTRRLEGKGITVNCMYPGFVRTGIWKNAGILGRLIIFAYPFMRSQKKEPKLLFI